MTQRVDIPDPAYWAITQEHGAQFIKPGTEIYEAIVNNLGKAATHGIIGVGDILEASDHSRALDPESMGISREAISAYPPAEEQ